MKNEEDRNTEVLVKNILQMKEIHGDEDEIKHFQGKQPGCKAGGREDVIIAIEGGRRMVMSWVRAL